MVKFALAILIAFAALVGVMTFSQEQLLFPTDSVAPADPLPAGAGRLGLERPGNVRLSGVHIPPVAASSQPRTLVLGFGGNAWNGDNVASFLHHLYPQAHVVVFHYRGYAPSSGRPSAEALIEDAPLVLDSALERVQPERTVAVGFSIGSGVAAGLAKSGKINGLVLVTPFDSLRKVAADLYPWLPVGAFFRNEIDAVGPLQGSEVPVAIVAAERDEIIPAARTEALREKVSNLVYDRTIGSAGHNDIYQRADFQQAMREAFAAVTK